jgi:lipoprotein-anchoring transpeptidase ErfK/SrfK
MPSAPPPLGASSLLGVEPLSIGGNSAQPAPLGLPIAPAALEGPGGASSGAAVAPSLLPSPMAVSGATITAPPPAIPSAPPGTAPSPAPAGAVLPVDRALVLDRKRRQLSLLENGRVVRRFPVAVGMPGWETPVGRFQVVNKTENPVWEHPQKGTHTASGPANPLGSRWIGFHQDCQGKRGWDGEHMLDVKGCVVAGFHGTPHRWTVGQALSHGCVRLYDEDVRQVFDFVAVGTPVTVLP